MKFLNSIIIIILTVVCLPMELYCIDNQTSPMKYISQTVTVELLPGGLKKSSTVSEAINISQQTLHESTFRSSDNVVDTIFDKEGIELHYTIQRQPDLYVFTVTLQKSIAPGDTLVLKIDDKTTKVFQGRNGICFLQVQ